MDVDKKMDEDEESDNNLKGFGTTLVTLFDRAAEICKNMCKFICDDDLSTKLN